MRIKYFNFILLTSSFLILALLIAFYLLDARVFHGSPIRKILIASSLFDPDSLLIGTTTIYIPAASKIMPSDSSYEHPNFSIMYWPEEEFRHITIICDANITKTFAELFYDSNLQVCKYRDIAPIVEIMTIESEDIYMRFEDGRYSDQTGLFFVGDAYSPDKNMYINITGLNLTYSEFKFILHQLLCRD